MSNKQFPRRSVLKGAGGITATGAISTVVAGTKDRYPTVADRGAYEGKPISVFAAGATKHPSQDRFAVVTAAFGHGLQLYIAHGASSLSDVPSTIYQITSDASAGVFDLDWTGGNDLKYTMDYARYTRQIPPSYVVQDHKMQTEDVLSEE